MARSSTTYKFGHTAWNKGKTGLQVPSDETKRKLSERFLNKPRQLKNVSFDEWRRNLSAALRGKPKPKVSDETKRKMRIAAVNRVFKNGRAYSIGTNETEILNRQEEIDHCKIQRQILLKDLGYIVDGYCPETNTVYEVYENRHDRTVQRDLERETEICNHLSCDFVIIWDCKR